jgi:ribosomal protein S18 acetylase RimI-like enzyme
MSEQLLIRPAQMRDRPGFQALYRHLIADEPLLDEAVAETRFAKMLAHPGMTILGGFIDGVPVATCTLIIIPNLLRGARNYALIENVVTDATHRQKGYARQVLNAAVTQAFENDCYKVMLMTGSTNPAVLRFYDESGFSRTKTGFEIRRL